MHTAQNTCEVKTRYVALLPGYFKSLKLKLKKQQQKSYNDPATLDAKNKKRQMTILFLHVNKTLAFTGSQ